MIDCHCHLLPGIDDGAGDLNTALVMARVAVEAGIESILVTPHHNDGAYTNSRNQIRARVVDFDGALRKNKIPLQVYPGSELHIVPELLSELQSGQAMTYADLGKAALLELPKGFIPQGAWEIIESVSYLGIRPVLAHPERNAAFCQNPDLLGQWFERGCTFQLTTQSCTGLFGKEIQQVCQYWIQKGWVHFVASDAHRPKRRSPDMRDGVEQIRLWGGDEVAHMMSYENPRRLTIGEPILSLPERKPKRTGFFSWLG